MRLGKLDYEYDHRTLRMVDFIEETELTAPVKHSFYKGRAPVPLRMWGNDAWGNCVFVGQVNHLLCNERVEQKRTVRAQDEDVINVYQALTGARYPGDENDQGYVMLHALNWWRQNGWVVRGRNYTIDAFGELDPLDKKQCDVASYLLRGIQLGFALPRSAESQTQDGYWDVVEGPDSRPGSWGGHAVFSATYDEESRIVRSWGAEIRVSNEFIAKYCDEAWAVVDSLDKWRRVPGIDTMKLADYLKKIGARKRQLQTEKGSDKQ